MFNPLENAIFYCSDAIVDSLWAILKYKEISITRKIKSMSEILGLDFHEVLCYLPHAADGRLLDYETRQLLNNILIKKYERN